MDANSSNPNVNLALDSRESPREHRGFRVVFLAWVSFPAGHAQSALDPDFSPKTVKDDQRRQFREPRQTLTLPEAGSLHVQGPEELQHGAEGRRVNKNQGGEYRAQS